jgi:hypothetical protein
LRPLLVDDQLNELRMMRHVVVDLFAFYYKDTLPELHPPQLLKKDQDFLNKGDDQDDRLAN